MPDRLTDERLHALRDDEAICTNAGERSMAAELIEARAWISADKLTLDRVADELGCSRPQLDLWFARNLIASLEADRNVVVGQLRTSREIAAGLRLLVANGEQEIAALYTRVAKLEGELREEGNRAGYLADLLRAACVEGADARARVHELGRQLDRVTDLFEKWAAEENEHRKAGEFGIAEGLHVAIEELRAAVHGKEDDR